MPNIRDSTICRLNILKTTSECDSTSTHICINILFCCVSNIMYIIYN